MDARTHSLIEARKQEQFFVILSRLAALETMVEAQAKILARLEYMLKHKEFC